VMRLMLGQMADELLLASLDSHARGLA